VNSVQNRTEQVGKQVWQKGGPSPNPKGRKPGPTLPTLILKDAYLLAAQVAGGGDEDGLVKYLATVAQTHPAAFLSGLSRIIPLQVDVQGSGNITIEIIKRFDDAPDPKLIEHKTNGHANGHAAVKKDPPAE
jgi:hypothetical protein